jgi:hypothetical protein
MEEGNNALSIQHQEYCGMHEAPRHPSTSFMGPLPRAEQRSCCTVLRGFVRRIGGRGEEAVLRCLLWQRIYMLSLSLSD